MKRAELTIFGVPAVRYRLARESRLDQARAQQQCPDGGNICKWTLVDRLAIRADLEVWWSRDRQGHLEAEQAFPRRLLLERIPWRKHQFTRDGTSFTVCEFRHSVHFTLFKVYEPKTQAELDAAAGKREAKKRRAELDAAPLFAGGAS